VEGSVGRRRYGWKAETVWRLAGVLHAQSGKRRVGRAGVGHAQHFDSFFSPLTGGRKLQKSKQAGKLMKS